MSCPAGIFKGSLPFLLDNLFPCKGCKILKKIIGIDNSALTALHPA